ncbi:MAG: sigma-70 family RNA polymerase sigma factor [Phycisphaera sp.]|nr:sigma-70 family RNA polymerase sigma factor [Phycisphaera sp.]
MDHDTPHQTETFLRLFAKHEQDVRRFLFSLLLDREATDEAFQNTSVALWRKFGEYDAAQPFVPWALAFARLEALKQRDRARRGRLVLNEGLIERLADERAAEQDETESRRRAMRDCLDKLPDTQRQLVRRRYATTETVAALAEQLGERPKRLYKQLERIRAALMDCVNQALAETSDVEGAA